MGQLESFNPATGELVGTVETIQPKDVDGIVADIAEIQPFWAQLTRGTAAAICAGSRTSWSTTWRGSRG